MNRYVFLFLVISSQVCLGKTTEEVIDPTVLLIELPSKTVKAAEMQIAAKQAEPAQGVSIKLINSVLGNTNTETNMNFLSPWPTAIGTLQKGPARQLLRERISSDGLRDDSASKAELAKSVNQLRSIEIARPQSPDSKLEPIILKTSGQTQKSEPNIKLTTVSLPDANADDAASRIIRLLIEKSSAIEDSFSTAEILYIKGYFKEAAIFYRQSLNQPNLPSQEKAWILYQIGNCLRNSDTASALASYRQLITEFPQSPWTEAAKAQERVLDWLQKEKVKELVK